MKKILIIFFLLSACSTNQKTNKASLENLNFSDNLTINEFKIRLEEYALNSPYPNIDN
tara:strand:- start:184 stop:357 length:174 start_codon:yes stop_codon:yes gene_type:complete